MTRTGNAEEKEENLDDVSSSGPPTDVGAIPLLIPNPLVSNTDQNMHRNHVRGICLQGQIIHLEVSTNTHEYCRPAYFPYF